MSKTCARSRPVSYTHLDVYKRQGPGRAALRVVRGPQTGTTFTLDDDLLSIGRSPQCGVFLNDMTVSRQHATIMRTERGRLITDEHSFNGVWVNNENVDAHLLQAGDIIQIGAFCLLYQEE